MDTTKMLDGIAAAVERVLKDARPAATKQMGPDAFAAYALDQVEKAAKDPPEHAVRRLRALGGAVDAAKQAFVDQASETIDVQVFEEETTAAADESEKDISPVAAEPALGNSSFAQNPEDLHKRLDRLRKDLDALRGGEARPADDVRKGAGDAVWPSDMNTQEFRKNVRKAEGEPAWGPDPAVVRNPEA